MSDELTPPQEATLAQSTDLLMSELPAPVRAFLQGPERDAVAMRLSQKHNLHVDQAGKFELAFLYMLLGISSPEEFVSALKEAGLPQETIDGLLADVNEQVFIPLRKEEQKPSPSSRATPVPTSPRPPLPPVFPVATSSTQALRPPIYIPTPRSAPTPTAPPQTTVASVPSEPTAYQTPSVSQFDHPSMRTMATDMQAVKEHRVPEPIYAPPVPRPIPVVPPPTSASNAQQSPPQSTSPGTPDILPQVTPRTAPPPSNLPGAPHLESYSSDPYREPVE